MPRLIPIMLVHGFDGLPTVWTESGFRQRLILDGDLDPNLVRAFDYGVADDGTYNNRADLRGIASRLAGANVTVEERLMCSVDQLSDNSVARGGPPQVTLIADSLGGIICRYYLSRSTPDQWGGVYRGNVGKLITIGTPHRGVDLARITELMPRGSPIWWLIRLLEKLGLAPARPASVVRDLNTALRQKQVTARGAPADRHTRGTRPADRLANLQPTPPGQRRAAGTQPAGNNAARRCLPHLLRGLSLYRPRYGQQR